MPKNSALDSVFASVDGARALLAALGFAEQQSNERSALTLLALCGLKEGDGWRDATQPLMGITQIIDWIAVECGHQYAPNTRETIRDETVRFFLDAGLVEKNFDDPNRPTNSPRTNYRVTDAAHALVRSVGEPTFPRELERYRIARGKVADYVASRQNAARPVVLLPDGEGYVELSPGGQSGLIQAIIEEFCPRFASGARVLIVDDTTHPFVATPQNDLEKKVIDAFGQSDAKPDVVLIAHCGLFVIEACQSGGPIDDIRLGFLRGALAEVDMPLHFITCFESRRAMAKYLSQLAWGTDAWCADEPNCIVALETMPSESSSSL